MGCADWKGVSKKNNNAPKAQTGNTTGCVMGVGGAQVRTDGGAEEI